MLSAVALTSGVCSRRTYQVLYDHRCRLCWIRPLSASSFGVPRRSCWPWMPPCSASGPCAFQKIMRLADNASKRALMLPRRSSKALSELLTPDAERLTKCTGAVGALPASAGGGGAFGGGGRHALAPPSDSSD